MAGLFASKSAARARPSRTLSYSIDPNSSKSRLKRRDPDNIAFDLVLQIGVESGEPVLNWIRVERRRESPSPDNRWSTRYAGASPTGSALRRIPVDRVFAHAFERVAIAAAQHQGRRGGQVPVHAGRRNNRMTPELLSNVARIVEAKPAQPNRAVQGTLY